MARDPSGCGLKGVSCVKVTGKDCPDPPSPCPCLSHVSGYQGGSTPEGVLKFNFDVEGTLRLVGTLHAQPKLSAVAATCGKGEDGEDLGEQGSGWLQ